MQLNSGLFFAQNQEQQNIRLFSTFCLIFWYNGILYIHKTKRPSLFSVLLQP